MTARSAQMTTGRWMSSGYRVMASMSSSGLASPARVRGSGVRRSASARGGRLFPEGQYAGDLGPGGGLSR